MDAIPLIDISSLISRACERNKLQTAELIGAACRELGFFYISGHGVDEELVGKVESLSRRFFALPLEKKMDIHMRIAGKAWRGYFPFGDELTGGMSDQKEGLYFGEEFTEDHPLVVSNTPLHGRNLFPDQELPSYRCVVLEYQRALTEVGHALMRGIALSLNLPEQYFHDRYTKEPTILFQVMHYPPACSPLVKGGRSKWGISEHTDYGLLTILRQDNCGGLEVKTKAGSWLQAVPIPGTFVVNIGDMLDRMTGGVYRSTPHRVHIPQTPHPRLSLPFFFDPNFSADVKPIEQVEPEPDDAALRWDRASVRLFEGTYGEYLLMKVSRVFPQLKQQVLA